MLVGPAAGKQVTGISRKSDDHTVVLKGTLGIKKLSPDHSDLGSRREGEHRVDPPWLERLDVVVEEKEVLGVRTRHRKIIDCGPVELAWIPQYLVPWPARQLSEKRARRWLRRPIVDDNQVGS